MVPMARILVVGVVFIAAPCEFAELKPTRQPISANAAAETNFMLSPLCVSLIAIPHAGIGFMSTRPSRGQAVLAEGCQNIDHSSASDRCLLRPHKRPKSGHFLTAASCHERTHAPQQNYRAV